jgi:rSAM/selenodomain-associated transferase 1
VQTVAIGIFCKTPTPGLSKTRLSPPLRPDECAELSACFIRDVAATIHAVAQDGRAVGYAVYTPAGSERALRALLPPGFRLLLQAEGDFGHRLSTATGELLRQHAGAILVSADSPTLPAAILRGAVDATLRGGTVALSAALDGGYTLIGTSRLHPRLYQDMPWSTEAVHRLTVERANEIGLPVTHLPGWYDVDDADSLSLLEAELAGVSPAIAGGALTGASAPATRAHLAARTAPQRAGSAR